MRVDLFYALCRASSFPQIVFDDHPYTSFESLSYEGRAPLTPVGI